MKRHFGCRVRIAHGWEGDGREGVMLGSVYTDREWAIVVWDDGEDPHTFKARGLHKLGQVNWLEDQDRTEEIQAATPSSERLLEIAKDNPPPDEWWEEDQEQ